MSGVEPQASTSTAPAATAQDADVPGPSWAGVDEDPATTNGETRTIPEDSTSGIETLGEEDTSHSDLRQRRIERFSSQTNNQEEEE